MRRRNFIGGLAVALVVPLQLKAATQAGEITLLDRWILRQQDPETLAEWSCILNGWGWPKLLPNPERPTYIPDGRRGQVIRWIKNRIGSKAVSWKHNQSVMSRKQFEDWWNSWHGGNKEEYDRKHALVKRSLEEEYEKRIAHTRAMYVRHGAEHLQYEES